MIPPLSPPHLPPNPPPGPQDPQRDAPQGHRRPAARHPRAAGAGQAQGLAPRPRERPVSGASGQLPRPPRPGPRLMELPKASTLSPSRPERRVHLEQQPGPRSRAPPDRQPGPPKPRARPDVPRPPPFPPRRYHCENLASNIFRRANRVDRAGRANADTAKAFYAASIFYDVSGRRAARGAGARGAWGRGARRGPWRRGARGLGW
jgi:hypothetical protein